MVAHKTTTAPPPVKVGVLPFDFFVLISKALADAN